jgi:hypothetical protein
MGSAEKRLKRWKRSAEDALYDRPITEEGADLLARRLGWRFAGWLDPVAHLTPYLDRIESSTPPAERFAAGFVPVPDDGRRVNVADGRTKNRALRRGIEFCRGGIPGALTSDDLEETLR